LAGVLVAGLLVAVPSGPASTAPSPSCQGLPATITGSGKGDRIVGTHGDDVIVGTRGADRITGLGGDDVICAGGGKDVVHGGAGRDLILGGGGADELYGGAGDDRIVGGGGADRLYGESGGDVLDGGKGRDLLNGGKHHDVCVKGEKLRRCESRRLPSAKSVDIDDELVRTGSTLLLTGAAPANNAVRVSGGQLPVVLETDARGRFRGAITLTPGTSRIVVTSLASGRSAQTTVRWQPGPAAGEVTGRVVDATSQAPVAGARVTLDAETATTGADGRFSVAAPRTGLAVVQVAADGYLSGVAQASLVDGAADAGDVAVAPLVEPESVGPEGGTLDGAGWSLEVPAGAVAEETGIQVTELPFTGLKDASYGIPLFDLSPSGLRFDSPVTLTIDNPLPELVDGPVVLTGLEPDTLTTRTHSGQVRDGQITVKLSSFEGEELRIDPTLQEDQPLPGPTNKWGGDAAFCTPFASEGSARYANAYLHATLIPFLSTMVSGWNAALWLLYLEGDSTGTVAGLPLEPTEDFIDNKYTSGTLESTLDTILARARRGYVDRGTSPRPLPGPPTGPAIRYGIEELDPGTTAGINGATRTFGPGEGDVDYSVVLSPPGNAAGGTGSYIRDGIEHPDRREFSGTLTLEAKVTSLGVVAAATLVTGTLSYLVHDSIDLCPGDPGTGSERNATIPLSRLESTPTGTGTGTWAAPVVFEIDQTLPADRFTEIKKSVRIAHLNDQDGDGWPETQPYPGATFTLDNCPNDANPGQEDSDDDGLGDRCDVDECELNPDICELPALTSKWGRLVASGSLGGNGATASLLLQPTISACHEWPGRANWSPTPCYHSVAFSTSGVCVYKHPKTGVFHDIACASLYKEPPGWNAPPLTQEADTYNPGRTGPVTSCGASGSFDTYIYGGRADDPAAIWSSRGPTALTCRVTWAADRPDAMPGKAYYRVGASLRGAESPNDPLHSGLTGLMSTWVEIKGKIVER